MLLLSISMFAIIIGVNGQCSLEEEKKLDNICNGEITCHGTVENLMTVIKSWHCVRGQRYYNHYENFYDYELSSNYILNINVKDADSNISEDPLLGLMDVSTNVVNLNIDHGSLVSIPIEVSSLVALTGLTVTYNQVETINLRKLSAGASMKSLNVSHNCISTIEEDLVDSPVPSLINSIDLSYNKLESLSDNCFARFPQLKYLDLSSNFLKHLDILTFEGIAQLEILQLSNNNIPEIGRNFARFKKLKYLALDNNQLSTITDLNLKTLVNLVSLNLSSNLIKHIGNRSLDACTNLQQLDLSHNKINLIHRNLFEYNINMYELFLSYNDIERIEGGAFRTANITDFDVQNNCLTGSIEYDTFLGISVENLDLSNGKLSDVGDKAFSSLSSSLKYLNISTNLLQNISESAFHSMQTLLKLDLSHNNLIDMNFNTSDLIQLTEYYIQNNQIKKIGFNMFKNMKNLVKLHLAQNKIVDIELNSFTELIKLKELNLSRNHLTNSLTANTFRGLFKLETLDLSNTRLESCLNESFSGMISLNYLNLSHSQIKSVEYETFKATGAIKTIDLSNNVLEFFYINTSSIPQISELYLSHNKLQNITSETFKNLRFLEKLSLDSNNILIIDSSSFKTLSHLRFLNLFSNFYMHINSNIFNNLLLSEVSIRNVLQRFNFRNAVNTSISTLILSHCEIEDINSIFVYNIKNVLKLDISSNIIQVLDKGSFQNMAYLILLDISYNKISTIQPGTFLSNKMINTLNLCGNKLQSLRFGVLDGLSNLRVLNLSNNEIHTFGVNLLHTSPYLSDLFLENNKLTRMDFAELSQTSVNLLTIGGNTISCDEIADWNKLDRDGDLNVTAESLDFHSENIYGIRCKTNYSRPKITQNNNTKVNISSEIIDMKDTVKQLHSYLKTSLSETFSKINAFLENFPQNSPNISGQLNNSALMLSEQLKAMVNQNRELLPQLVNTSFNIANDIKLMISLLQINNNLTKQNNIQKELFITPVSSKTVQKEEHLNSTDIAPKLYETQPHAVKLDESTLVDKSSIDRKVLLCFIAICIAIVIVFSAILLAYRYWYTHYLNKVRKNHLYDSGQSVGNGLEME